MVGNGFLGENLKLFSRGWEIGGLFPAFRRKKYAFSGFPQNFFSSFRDSEMASSAFRPHFLYFFGFPGLFLVLFRLYAKSILN